MTIPGSKKTSLRELAKKTLDNLKDLCIIDTNHTGKVTIEMNVNQGSLTDIKVSPEIRA